MSSFPQSRRSIACCMLLLLVSQEVILAADKAVQSEPAELQIHDVRLSDKNELKGVVVTSQGKTLQKISVALQADGKTVQKTTTDQDGRFSFTVDKGGSFQIVTSEGIVGCRAWTAKAAPPVAANQILIVHGSVVRGQRPIRELFRSDPIFAAGVLAAAIAIPIAIHESQSDSPSGS